VADKDLHLARALLVEGNPLLRSVTAQQLRDVGVAQIHPIARIRDARLTLERERYDIVVCSREFEGSEDSGQDLLDELRRERLLSPSTVFIMITREATYHQVMEAAEAALDGFLVRPYTGVALGQRLLEARQRKRELGDILRALDAGDTEAALTRALRRFSDRGPFWMYCGRLAAELLLVLKRAGDALRLFEKLAAPKPATWARLGVARSHFAAGDLVAAKRAALDLLASEPDCADARDLLGRIYVEHCEFDAALAEYRLATSLTPGCLLRQQHTGALAFYQGQAEEALRHLNNALSLGIRSSLFDALTLLLVAMLRFDAGDTPGLLAAREQLRRYAERYPASDRLERMGLGAEALVLARTRDIAAAAPALKELAALADTERLDLEAATMLLALAWRLAAAFDSPAQFEQLVQRLGRRFVVSKAITEVLTAAAGRSHPASGILQGCHVEVSAVAEQALEGARHGAPAQAVALLLERGEQWRNTRLLDLGRSLVRRHAEQLPDAPADEARAASLLQRYGHGVNHIAGIQRSGRTPGAMHLRGVQQAGAAAAAPPALQAPIPA
jgi:Tfp pilus assembly protein PilF/CheY-like chemotaxis protein